MKLDDLEKVRKLETKLSNCNFHLKSLRFGPSGLKMWDGDKGAILERYGDRFEYLSEPFVNEVHAGVVRELEARRAEHVAELKALGVDVDTAAAA